MQPRSKIKLYPENRSLFFDVYVWPYKKNMIKFLLQSYRDGLTCKIPIKFHAITFCYRENYKSNSRLTPRIGEIHLPESSTLAEVTHELFHATLGYARRLRLYNILENDELEERLAWLHGNMMYQFLYKMKIKDAA